MQDIIDDSIPAHLITSSFSSTCIDLISAPLGSQILSFSDEWFAPAINLTKPSPPVQKPGVYVATGAWYDGWETRRHNPAHFDWVVIKLGPASGRVRGVEIDSAFFNGNHAEGVAVQACFETGPEADDKVKGESYGGWLELLGRRECGPNRRQGWKVATDELVTHVRLLMFPDGGIARFRLYGDAVPAVVSEGEVELSAAIMGGVAVGASDEHYGVKGNLLLPGRGKDMGDGWETKRSRGQGHEDWVVVRLAARGLVNRVVVDTAHFLGNFPQGVRVEGADVQEGKGIDGKWVEMLSEQKLGPGQEHEFGKEVLGDAVGKCCTHMRMTIIPDGGVKRFRVFGTVAKRT